MSRVGQVWRLCKGAIDALVLVVREDHAVHVVDLESGEPYEWTQSDFSAHHRRTGRMRRVA